MGDDFSMGIVDKMFSRMVNEKVEESFKSVFGELAWDSNKLDARKAALVGK